MKVQVTSKLPLELKQDIDRTAFALGIQKSEVVAQAVVAFLKERQLDIDAAIFVGRPLPKRYAGGPPAEHRHAAGTAACPACIHGITGGRDA